MSPQCTTERIVKTISLSFQVELQGIQNKAQIITREHIKLKYTRRNALTILAGQPDSSKDKQASYSSRASLNESEVELITYLLGLNSLLKTDENWYPTVSQQGRCGLIAA